MKVFIFCFVAFAIAFLADPTKASPSVRVRRQWDWGTPNNNRPRPSRPTPRPVTPTPSPLPPDNSGTTTSSPQYLTCIDNCRVTPQYNPVCGSNRLTYENEGKLRCAQRCGLDVQVLVGGACSS